MIKVSHETPLCLLEDSRLFNDYDYCLPHLLDQEQGYQDYFLTSVAQGRYIDRKSTRLNSSHSAKSRMPSSA